MAWRNRYYDFLTVLGVLIGRHPLCGPRIAQINISDSCNLDCVMCNRSCFDLGGFMPYERVVDLVDQLYALGLQEVYFHGYGEPFLHPRLGDLLARVHRTCPALRQFLVTNGTCVTDELAYSVRENQVRVRFSIHAGDQETWAKVHPNDDPRHFGRIRSALEAIGRGRESEVEVLYVLFKTNWNTIDSMIGFARETGVKRVLFRPMRFYNDDGGRPMNWHLQLDREQYEVLSGKLLQTRSECAAELAVDITPFLHSCYDPAAGRPSSLEFYLSRACYIGWVLTVVLGDGRVLGCLEESFDGDMGNALKMPFEEIWWSERYQRFRQQQLFKDKSRLDRAGCHAWCQHLRANLRLNDVAQRPWRALSRRRP